MGVQGERVGERIMKSIVNRSIARTGVDALLKLGRTSWGVSNE